MAKNLVGKSFSVTDPPDFLDPNLREVARLMSVYLNDVFYKYGVELLPDKKFELKGYETSNTILQDKCLKLVELWINSRHDAKWKQLIEAANRCGLGGLERALNEEFTSPQEPQSGITESVQGKSMCTDSNFTCTT